MRVVLSILLLVSSATVSSADWPQMIEIFIAAPVRMNGISDARGRGVVVEVLDVSAAARIESRLSKSLPATQSVATRQGKKRLRHVTAKEKSEVLDGVRARYRAAEYGIDQFPAIVIDGMYIFGNTTSIVETVRHWRSIKGK